MGMLRDTGAGAREEQRCSSAAESLVLEAASKARASSFPPLPSSSTSCSLSMQRPSVFEYHHRDSSSSNTASNETVAKGAQTREAYRTDSEGVQSSTHTHTRFLPPMQRFEGHAQQAAHYSPMPHAHHPPAHVSSAYPPPYAYQNGGVLQPAPPMLASIPSGHNGLARYPIPPQAPLDSRSMSAGKKDIKRRTKTGCLTCRKRRIKCDEAQPACRNCAKSKRDCLGYDPIFKSSGSATTPIQPAPSSNGTPPANPGASATQSNPYGNSTYPLSGVPLLPSNDPDPPPYSYGTSLDPALAGGDASLAMADAKPQLHLERKPKHITMDDLFALNDLPPQYEINDAPALVSPAMQQEIADFYTYHYGPGLDRLLETDWYTRSGLRQLQQDAHLQDFVAQCIEQFKSRTDDVHATNAIKSLEARLVWQLATMCRTVSTDTELVRRVDTLENLLTGGFLDPSNIPIPPPTSQARPGSGVDNEKYNELSFWHHLGRLVSIRDDRADHTAMREVAHALASMRGILNMLENRDVLYSVAVVRQLGGRVPEFHPHRHLVASTNDPNDEMNKLKVAQQFVETEDQRGTTQVIQRTCSMALRSWVLQRQ